MRILGLFFLCLSLPLFADVTMTTQIHDVDYGTQMGDEVLVFLTSGHVVKVKNLHDLGMIEDLQSAKGDKDQWFKLTWDKDRYITKVQETDAPYEVTTTPTDPVWQPVSSDEKSMDLDVGPSLGDGDYVSTTIPSMEYAKNMIAESRKVTKAETQCFNRAMVWTYEWWKKHSIKSKKVYVFWTKEYVRRYGFEWWFHVSPYVHVMDKDGIVKERTLDVKWLSRPYAFQEWVDYHSPKDIKCLDISRYSEYANYPWGTERCYFYRSTMYSWMPSDLELYEAWPNYTKSAFNMTEVRSAYLEAFDMTL
jgi:hypothetical protein